MSRFLPLLLLGGVALLGPGCVSAPHPPPLTTVIEWTPESMPHESGAVAASALVFAPSVSANQPAIDLDRASRQRSALLGYDGGSIETYSITVDDRQSFGNYPGWGCVGRGGFGFGWGYGGWNDCYQRQVYSERVGSIRR